LSSSDDQSQLERRPARQPAAGKSDVEPPVPREQQMGDALRSVYQRAVDEKVPDDLMDLLGKLG